MKSQILLLVAAAMVPSVLADKPKLNQYSTLENCNNDKDILYHAAPISGKCYNLDDATGAFFYNGGGMWFPKAYTNKDCTGIEDALQTSGRCMDKGDYNSYKAS